MGLLQGVFGCWFGDLWYPGCLEKERMTRDFTPRVDILPPLIAPDARLKIASLIDLAGTKASALQARAEAKDDFDIDALPAGGRIDFPLAMGLSRACRRRWPIARRWPRLCLRQGSLARIAKARSGSRRKRV